MSFVHCNQILVPGSADHIFVYFDVDELLCFHLSRHLASNFVLLPQFDGRMFAVLCQSLLNTFADPDSKVRPEDYPSCAFSASYHDKPDLHVFVLTVFVSYIRLSYQCGVGRVCQPGYCLRWSTHDTLGKTSRASDTHTAISLSSSMPSAIAL